jgi:1-deoxy-D-xylulose-5-phosphate reductoisomerase
MTNHRRLAELVRQMRPLTVSFDGKPSPELSEALEESGTQRVNSVSEAFRHAQSAVVVSAGLDGYQAAEEAIRRRLPVAIGNKEAFVAWGRYLKGPLAAAAGGCDIRPVDSEHAAASILINEAGGADHVAELIITGSGGAVRDILASERHHLQPSRVLHHPVWKMGSRITVDSATLVNKALEVVEAAILFDIAPDKIQVMFDQDATVHAAVITTDGRTSALVSPASMEGPVRTALGLDPGADTVILKGAAAAEAINRMRTPDAFERRAIGLGHLVLSAGGCMPMVLAAADESAVARFLAGALSFGDIVPFIEKTIESFARAASMDPASYDDLTTLRRDLDKAMKLT